MARLPAHELVLVGAGHTNLHIVRKWMHQPIADVQLTVVSPSHSATYSGMFPGTLAGLYNADEMLIDLDQLTHTAGVRLLVAECTGVDVTQRQILLKDRPPVHFDIVSVGVGSRPAGLQVVQTHPGLISVKPMFTALQRLRQRCAQLSISLAGSAPSVVDRPVSAVVVGGGAAGVEIAFCLQSFLQKEFPSLAGSGMQITLVDRNASVLKGYRSRTVSLAQRLLHSREIQLCLNRAVTGCDGTQLILDDRTTMPADLVIWCAGAAPMPLLEQIDVPRSNDGFLRVQPTLQSVCGSPVFAVGDSASIEGADIPRAGVYAVRQGPILWQNIQRLLSQQPLVPYRPQRDFLSLLATGDGQAIGQYRRFSAHGKWLWKIKNSIDTSFMNMHRPAGAGMNMDRETIGKTSPSIDVATNAMRCRGCGGKTSARVLTTVLERLRAELSTGDSDFLQPEDCAILSEQRSTANAVSVDMFSAFLEDPWIVGRVAAIHALSDLWARSILPTVAMAHVIVPSGSHRSQSELLYQLLNGAVRELQAAGVVLAGGHTMDGDELSIGLTVLGRTPCVSNADKVWPGKSGLQPGQRLVLTKPLGTGVILAGRELSATTSRNPRKACGIPSSAAMVQSAVQIMLQPNGPAATIAAGHGVTGMTDVTGFGLAGHLLEMLTASGVVASLQLSQIPLLPGVVELLEAGIRSSLDPENRLEEKQLSVSDSIRNTAIWSILFDPQTSGGLLFGVDDTACTPLLAELHSSGYVSACVVGAVAASRPDASQSTTTDDQRLVVQG